MRYARTAAPAAAIALVLAGSAAQAAPVDAMEWIYECIDGTEWELGVDGYFDAFAVDEASVYPDAACEEDSLQSDAFDGLWAIWLASGEEGAYYGETDTEETYVVDRTVADNGDVVFTGPVETILGLNVQVQIRFYADGDMVRVLASYTNPTAAPIVVETGSDSGYGSDEDIRFVATSSGDAAPTTVADNWAVTSDTGYGDPVLSNAWQAANAPWRAADLELYADHGDIDNMWTGGVITVAPGATVHLAYFTKLYGYETEVPQLEGEDLGAAAIVAADLAAAEAAAVAGTSEFASFSGRLTAGLAGGTVVLNWGTVGGATAPPATPVPGRPSFTG